MRISVSSFRLTTKCPFGAHFSHPHIKCTLLKCLLWSGALIEGSWRGEGCVQTRGGESGWVYSKRKRPTGTAAFYLSPGGGRLWGCLPLTRCCSPRDQFSTNEGCSWEQRGASGALQVARLTADTTEAQEMATTVSVHLTFGHCQL